jgi:hypothetical protein
MKKLLATLILGLTISGAALASEGYFADHQGNFSNVPAAQGQTYDGVALDWTWRPEPVPVTNPAGVAASPEQQEWVDLPG